MTVLFSPIGTADPLTQLGDGPMLHIVRHYRPDEVVLFLSPKMAALQDADERYTKSIAKLCAYTGQKLPTITLQRSERKDVHRFDGFIGGFEDIIADIRGKRRRETILANASSGTPAMEEAIVAIGAFGEYDITTIQVATPRRDANRPGDREQPEDFDLELLWAFNPDNESDRPSRAIEVKTPNFKERIVRKNVMALIGGYDYEGALVLAEQSSSVSPQAINLIAGAVNRLNLDVKKAQSSLLEMLPDYLWSLEVKMKQGHWADFVRALTPAYTWTARRLLEPYVPAERYLGNNGKEKLDWHKISNDEKLRGILGHAFKSPTQSVYLANWMLNDLAEAYIEDTSVKARLATIRLFEDDGSGLGNRNVLAHRIARAGKEEIEGRGHATFEQVMDCLFSLNGVKPGKFDELNRQILGVL